MVFARLALLSALFVTGCLGDSGPSSPPSTSRSVTPPIVSPSPTAHISLAASAVRPDAIVTRLLRQCGADCDVAATLLLTRGRRLVVLRSYEVSSSLVLLNAQRVLDTYRFDGYGGEVRTDRTGNILLLEQGNTAQAVQPLRLLMDHLVELAGFQTADRMVGDNNTRFVDHGGVLAIVIHRHAFNQDAAATITWRWNGRTYVAGPCIDSGSGRPGGPACT